MVAAFRGFGFRHVPVFERRGFATLRRAATRQQLSICPVQRAGFHQRVHLASSRHHLLGVARISSDLFAPAGPKLKRNVPQLCEEFPRPHISNLFASWRPIAPVVDRLMKPDFSGRYHRIPLTP